MDAQETAITYQGMFESFILRCHKTVRRLLGVLWLVTVLASLQYLERYVYATQDAVELLAADANHIGFSVHATVSIILLAVQYAYDVKKHTVLCSVIGALDILNALLMARDWLSSPWIYRSGGYRKAYDLPWESRTERGYSTAIVESETLPVSLVAVEAWRCLSLLLGTHNTTMLCTPSVGDVRVGVLGTYALADTLFVILRPLVTLADFAYGIVYSRIHAAHERRLRIMQRRDDLAKWALAAESVALYLAANTPTNTPSNTPDGKPGGKTDGKPNISKTRRGSPPRERIVETVQTREKGEPKTKLKNRAGSPPRVRRTGLRRSTRRQGVKKTQ